MTGSPKPARINSRFAAVGGQKILGVLTMKHYVYLAALAAMLVAGCSTTNTQSAATDDEDKVTVTGSRIPVKDRSAANKSTDRQTIDDFSRNQQIYVPPSGGRN